MMRRKEITPIRGIRYFTPPLDSVLEGRDGRVRINLEEVPLPLLEDDHAKLDHRFPSYDAIGRGIYHALRSNPDCIGSTYYAGILKTGYPHIISELATHVVMLDKKDVDAPYVEREINYLRIFSLIEPENPRLPLEIGMAYLNKGMSLSTLQYTTVSLYRAEKYLTRAVELAPEDLKAVYHLGEVSYILGKYDNAARLWGTLLNGNLADEQTEKLRRRLLRIEQGILSHVPAVDYLEVVAVALKHFEDKEWEEATALLLDVLDDQVFSEEFPIAELRYILGVCYQNMQMPKYAEDFLKEALHLHPEYAEAQHALSALLS